MLYQMLGSSESTPLYQITTPTVNYAVSKGCALIGVSTSSSCDVQGCLHSAGSDSAFISLLVVFSYWPRLAGGSCR
jgi:hypothetical protein